MRRMTPLHDSLSYTYEKSYENMAILFRFSGPSCAQIFLLFLTEGLSCIPIFLIAMPPLQILEESEIDAYDGAFMSVNRRMIQC
jgi:hypothetical protein